MKLLKYALWVVLVTQHAVAMAVDGGGIVTSRFDDIQSKVEEILQYPDGDQALFVFDIDNTVLKTETDFGSEHWFLWQKQLIENGVNSVPAITDSLEGLLKIQGWIYQISQTQAVASQIPATIEKIRLRGANSISITSRMLSVRDATIAELTRNQIHLSTAPELGLSQFLQPQLAYDPANLSASGLSEADRVAYSLNNPLLAEFDRGVFFTQGQHKGVILKILLHSFRKKFKYIVFVDDRANHVSGMRSVFEHRPEILTTFQFVKSAEWIDPFNLGDKADAQKQWCDFSKGLVASIPSSKENLFLCDKTG